MRPSQNLRSWLERELPRMKPGSRIPSDAELSERWGVSVRTVKKVLKEMGERGLVWRIQGKGTYVPDASRPKAATADAHSSEETVSESIYDAIASGELKVGDSLPSVKFMSLRFRVSARTVIHAYRSLQERGLVQKVGKTFWVGRVTEIVRQRPRRDVYVFHAKSHELTQIFRNDLLSLSYQRMEEELHNHGLVLRFEPLENLAPLLSRWAGGSDAPYGLVFFDMDTNLFADAYRLLGNYYSRPGRPDIRLLVDWRAGNLNTRLRWLQIVSRGNIITTFSRTVAQHAARGRGPAVFFFDESHPFWNTYNYIIPLVRIRAELAHIHPAMGFRFYVRTTDSSRTPMELIETLDKWEFERQLSKYEPTSLETLASEVALVSCLADAYEQNREAGLWLFSRDADAAEAIAWLRKQGLEVPSQVSVVGLENDPAYYHLGISHIGPDWERLGYLMAHALIGDIPMKRTRRGFIRSGARVRERLTS